MKQTKPQAMRPTLLRQMDMVFVTCVQIWMRAAHSKDPGWLLLLLLLLRSTAEHFEGHPVCVAHTRTCTKTGTVHRLRGLRVRPFSITPAMQAAAALQSSEDSTTVEMVVIVMN